MLVNYLKENGIHHDHSNMSLAKFLDDLGIYSDYIAERLLREAIGIKCLYEIVRLYYEREKN